MAGPMNTSPGVNWQSYQSAQNQGWVGPNGQQQMGQNGGNFTVQQPEQPPFVGRFINQIEEVMPREVPMDGRIAIFPTPNLEEIYLKAWDRYGSIKTFRYILDPNQTFNAPPMQQGPDMSSQILQRLDELEKKLGDSQNKPTNRRNNSKGGEENA